MGLAKYLKRTAIVFIWIFTIAAFLYLPHLEFFSFQEKSINIFAWGDALVPDVLAEFEKKTGIKVNLSFYSSNEELLIKMQATGGAGYDLILPSDYAVGTLIKEDLVQPLDHSMLNFLDDLNPSLLKHSFDPHNKYSVPFSWEILGLGVNNNFFAEKPFLPSWKSIYDPNVIDYKIAIRNDPIEAVLFAAFYLFGKTDSISQVELEKIRALLIQQRNWVEAYSDSRTDYFMATGNCPIALTSSAQIKRVRTIFPEIGFVIPEEGTFITIENFCISKTSKKSEYIYQLLNHLYTKDSYRSQYKNFFYFPATLSAIEEIDFEPYERRLLLLTREDFNQFHFIKNVLPQQQVRDLWVDVKSF